MRRHLFLTLLTVLAVAAARSAWADLEGKIARRAMEQKAAYDKALQTAMTGKRDLKWLDYLQQEIVRADQAANFRRLLDLTSSGARLLGRDPKQAPKSGELDSAIQSKQEKLGRDMASFQQWKLKLGIIGDLADYAQRLSDVGKRAEALAVYEEADRHLEQQRMQIAELEKWRPENEEMYRKAKAAGMDLSEVDALAAKVGAAAGDVPLIYAIGAEIRALLRELHDLPPEEGRDSGDDDSGGPPGGPPRADDKDNAYKCREFKCEIRKPPTKDWVFNLKPEDGFVLEIKNDAMGAYAELRAFHEPNTSVEETADRMQEEMKKWLQNYAEVSNQKITVAGKKAQQVCFTAQWKDDKSGTGLTGKRIYVRKAEVTYVLTWFTPTGKLDTNQKPLDEVLNSFRFQ